MYHTACCGLSGIMFMIEIVEGKDWPWELGDLELDENGRKMVYCFICAGLPFMLHNMLPCTQGFDSTFGVEKAWYFCSNLY